jgi:hypothetical protein
MAMTTVEERLSRLEGVYDHLASKADVAKVETQIADLRAELKGDIAGLRTELNLRAELKGDIAGLRTELKGDIAGLRTEMYRINAGSVKWLVSFMAGFMVVGLGGFTAIYRFLG